MRAASVFLKHALPWKAAVTLSLLASCVGCAAGLAQESEKEEKPPILFDRAKVPHADISKLKGKYQPYLRDEFDQKIKTIRSKEIARDAPLDARIVHASYSARLVNDELVGGTAELTIIHSAGDPAVVPMGPCGLAIEDLAWQAHVSEEPTEGAANGPSAAKMGLDDAGRVIALVKTSGVLQFNWSLRGQRETPDELVFGVQLPASPANRLKLEVPVGFEPTLQRGIVSEDPDRADDEAYRRWSIELGGNNSTDLRIVPSDGEEEAQRLVFLRQQTTYRLSQTGVDVLADLHLDVQNESLSQLTLVLEESVQLVSAEHADTRLNWTESSTGEGRKVVLDLPEPILGMDRTIQLHAVAPIAMAEVWKLPTLAVEGTIWLEGGANLEVPSPLALEHLAVVGGRQTKVAQVPSPDEGETVQIQFFKSDAVARAIVRPREGAVIVHQGTTVKVGPTRVNATHVADFVSTGSPRFSLEMETSSNWTIDQIETSPPDLIEEWSMKAGRVVQLRLREALTADRPLRVIVQGHRRGVRRGAWPGGQNMRFCAFRDVSIARSLVAVGAESPFQIQLAGDAELVRLGASELTDQEGEQVTWQAGGVAYVDGPAADNLVIVFSSDPPKFAADIHIQSDIGVSEINHRFEVACVPEASSIDRVLVHFSELSEENLRWLLNDDDDAALAARRLTLEEQQQAGTHGGETWEIVLPSPQDSSFKLTANRTEPFDDESPIPLVSLPGAASQVGSVTIRSPETVPIGIRQSDLNPIPPKPPGVGEYTTIRGAYRYEPSQLSRVSVARRTSDAQPRQAWIWLCQLASRFSEDGQATHEAVYRIENIGTVQFDLRPPKGCEILEAAVDGLEVALPADTSADPSLVIPLPRGVRFPTVVIRFVAQTEPLQSICRVSAPWPRTELQVFRREWIVWLPPGFDRLDRDRLQSDVAWPRSLFGPLLRSEDQVPFNPLSESHWRSLGVEGDALEEALLSQAETFLRDLARQSYALQEAADQDSRATWGELLASCEPGRQQADRESPRAIWVDQNRLSQAGITAQTFVDELPTVAATFEAAPASVGKDVDRGAHLLQRANLAVIAHDGGLLLTTAETLGRPEHSARAIRHQCITAVLETDLSTRLLPSVTNMQIVPIRAWTTQPPLPQQCWSIIPQRSIAGVTNDGWTVHVAAIPDRSMVEENGNEVTQLRIHQPQAVQALAWAAFLATAGLVWCMIRRWILLGIPLTMIAGLAALFAPAGLLAVFSASFLGAILATCLAVAFPRRKRRSLRKIESDSESRPSSVLVETAGLGLVAAITWMNVSCASAQEPSAAKPPAAAEIHTVLFPVEEDGQPSGRYVYVPEALARVLEQEGSAGGTTQRKWAICDADYSAIVRRVVGDSELAATELVAKFEVEVYRAKTNIILPVEQEQVFLLPNRARLNGQPASVSWMPGGKGLSVEVAQPGTCNLELAFRPRIERVGGKARFQLGIPPVPCSQLKVEIPDQASGVEFPTARGTVAVEEQTGLQVVKLGPTDLLSVRWPIDPSASSLSSALTVDQMMWLKVRPGSVVLDAKLKFTTLSGTIDRVQLLADPRLKILPHGSEQPIARSSDRTVGGVQTIWIELKPPFGREAAFDVSFVVNETWGVGNVRVPRLEAVADRTNRRWLAVSVADSLEFEQPKPADDSPSDAEFSAAWGQADETPQVVTRVPDDQTDWMVPTRPRETAVTAAQRLAVSVGRNKAEIQLDADIEIAGGSRFQYRVRSPKSVHVTNVSVVEGDTERAARWYHHDREGVIVRLDGPVTQTHRLQLSGEMPIRPNSTSLKLPRITLADVTLTADRVDVFRRSQVQIDLTNRAGFVDVAEAKLGAYREGWGRLVAAFAVPDGSSKPATIQARLRPNRPQTTARVVITLDRQDGVWQADADCRFQAANGVVDAIRLEVPPEWKEPFELESATEMEIVEVPDQTRRQLLIRPPRSVSDFRIRVRGALSASAGERVRAPDIVPLDVARLDRYLVAPTNVQGQQIAWETSGLQEARPPSGYVPELESYVSYYVVQDRFQATIRDVQSESGMARVHLTDIRVDCSDDGGILGLATFDLEPAGLSDCTLQLPEGYGLVHVMVGNLPAQLERMKADRWRFRLGSRQLPQQIQVLFTGTLHTMQWRQRTAIVQSPQLVGIPVEQTLWTVRGPGTGDIKLMVDKPCLDPLSHELLRLDQTTALVEAASDVVADSDSADISHWYSPWERRLIASHSRATHWYAASPAGGDQDAVLAASEVKRKEIATRLGAGELEPETKSGSSKASEPVDVWRIALDRSAPTHHCAFSGARETIEFRHTTDVKGTGAERWAAAAVLLGITVLCLVTLPNPSLEHCLRRYPQLLGIPLGMVWWLWLTPSLLGLIILLLAGLGSIGPLLRMARFR